MIEISRYFDWAATSPSDEKILKEALELTISNWGNPSSIHSGGKEAKALLDSARELCAKTLGVKSNDIYFTSGGTEADQIPLLSVLNKPQKGTVLISSIEHPAVREQALALKKCGWNVVQLKADKLGIITPDAVAESLTDDTHLVSVMAVNNETGIIQAIYEIADKITELTKGKRRPRFHVDCVQAAGKIPLDISRKGIDSAAFSAHKICGPRGIGILYSKDAPESFLKGGGQEKGIRSGTENVYGAVAFSKVLEKYFMNTSMTKDGNTSDKDYSPTVQRNSSSAFAHFIQMQHTTNDFITKLSSLNGCAILPEGRLIPENKNKFSPYIVQAAFKNIPGQVMLRALDAKGFCISTGSACSAKKANRPVLEAMHIDGQIRETAVRFSFGPLTTPDAVDALFAAVAEVNAAFNR